MARIRSIKPQMFKNEDLAELPFEARLCFIGLWGQADRDGRLEDRPKRLKVEIFPYDTVDMDAILAALHERGFIVRYTVDGLDYISIPTFTKHQRPKADEQPSVIPAPPSVDTAPLRPENEPLGKESAPLEIGTAPRIGKEAEAEAEAGSEAEAVRPAAAPAPVAAFRAPGVAPMADARSKRPIFKGNTFVVFEWQFDDLRRLLGAHFDAFDIHGWLDALDQQARTAGLIVPQRDGGKWLQEQTQAEAARRGLPVAATMSGGQGKTAGNMAAAARFVARGTA